MIKEIKVSYTLEALTRKGSKAFITLTELENNELSLVYRYKDKSRKTIILKRDYFFSSLSRVYKLPEIIIKGKGPGKNGKEGLPALIRIRSFIGGTLELTIRYTSNAYILELDIDEVTELLTDINSDFYPNLRDII